MICPACGAANIEGAEGCTQCGRDLGGLDLLDDDSPAFIREPLAALSGRPAATVGAGDPVGLAVRRMQDADTGCILVRDGDRLAGILTSWDILHKVAGPNEDLNAVTCRQVMTADPVLFNADDNVALAINRMAIGAFRHVPVAGGGEYRMLDVSDVFRFISPHLV